jgi:hypothetical protein
LKSRLLVLLLPALVFISSCTGSNIKFVLVHDTEYTDTWKEQQVSEKLTTIFEEYRSLKIDFQKIRRKGVFSAIKDDPGAFIKKTVKPAEDQMTILFCVRPWLTINDNELLFETIIATSLSQKGNFEYTPERLTSLDQVIDSVNQRCKSGAIATGDIFSVWEYTFKTRILSVFDPTHDIEWDSSDFSGYLEDFFDNNYAGELVIETVSDQDTINAIAANPITYIQDYIDPDYDKIGFLFYFDPFYSVANQRVEFEVKFVSSLSDPGATVMSEEMITSPMFILEKIDDLFVDEKYISNASFIFIGKPPSKCTIVINIDTSNGIKWKPTGTVMAIQEFFYENYSGMLTFEQTNTLIDLDGFATNPGTYIQKSIPFEEKDFDDLLFVSIKPYENTEFNKTGFELIFSSNMARADSIKSQKGFVDDPLRLLESIRVHFPEKSFDESTASYLFIQGKTLGLEILDYVTYQDIDSMKGTYLLITEIPGILKAGEDLSRESILTYNVFIPGQSALCNKLVEHSNNNDGADMFYDRNTNELFRKIYFIDFVTTGSSSLKLLYGPISMEYLSETRTWLAGKGFKTFNRPVYPYDFK